MVLNFGNTNRHLIRITILPAIFFFSLSCLGQANNSKINNSQRVDSTKYAIIQFDTTNIWVFKNAKPTTLTVDEIEEAELILRELIDIYNRKQQDKFNKISTDYPGDNFKLRNFIIDLSMYNRQYFPVINQKGEKEIWINFFCSISHGDWRKELVLVNDGGNCYFRIIINLTNKTYEELIVNGDA